jgi:FKBP-type peptidyl-prolyl cis-trans isomerase 2
MTQVKSGDTVVIKYTGRLEDNSIFDTSENREPLLLTIGQGKTIPALEEAIVGMEPGESKTLRIAASEAYGPYHEELVKTVSRRMLAEGLEPEVGQRLKATRMDGRKDSVTIKDVFEKSITLDANHPLAGKDLTFEVKLVEIV